MIVPKKLVYLFMRLLLGAGLLLNAWPSVAQPLSYEQLTGRWVGVSTEWDLDNFCSLPIFMDFNPDSTWQLSQIIGQETPQTGRWRILKGDSLEIGLTVFAPELIALQGDRLRIGKIMPMTFRRFRGAPMSRDVVWSRLAGGIWRADSTDYRIAADGRVGVLDRRTGEQTVHYADVVAVDESVFLVLRGSVHKREGNVQAVWQVIRNEVGKLTLVGGTGKTIRPETWRWVSALGKDFVLQPTSFQPCTNCFDRYRSNTFFGFIEANEHKAVNLFKDRYQNVDAPGQSGLMTLSFVQNCAGERSPVEWQEFDADYRKHPFDKRISDQLKTIVQRDLPGSLFETGDSTRTDVVVSFTFRFLDGHLVEIYR